ANIHADLVKPASRVLVGHTILRPQALNERKVLLEALDAFALAYPEGIKLYVPIAKTDAKHEIATGNDVEGRHRLCRVNGVVQIEQQNAEPERPFPALGRQPCQ